MSDNPFTHFDASGQAQMVDISEKSATHRIAVAEGWITMSESTFSLIKAGKSSKGDVLGVARIAAIQGAKKTAELIPLCHPLFIQKMNMEFMDTTDPWAIGCRATVQCVGPTGVEMEALTAVTIALLTIYDMCKAVDRGMSLGPIHLLEKSGGRSGHWQR